MSSFVFLAISLFFFHALPAFALESAENETVSEHLVQNRTLFDFLIPLANSSSVENFDFGENSTENFTLTRNSTSENVSIGCDPNEKPGNCSGRLLEICRSIDGVYKCACAENVTRTDEGKCTVFNECSSRNSHNCSSYADCLDLTDGYECRCKFGYRDAAEVENALLPGRVCISLHWVINGRKESAFTIESSASDGTTGTQPLEISPTASILEESAKISRNESANSTEIDSNEILADSPLSGESDSNSSIARTNLTQSSNFSFVNASSDAAASIFFTTALPKVIEKQKHVKTGDSLSNGVLKDVFSAFDSDGNELISFFELKTAVEKYRVRLTDTDVHQMIKVADLSGEGVVDFGEFISLMRRAS